MNSKTTVNPTLFSPGLPVVMEIKGYPQIKFTTFFRGCKIQSFIIIDHPAQHGRLLPLGEDTQCILRFIREGDIIGFKSRVLSVVRSPSPLLFLTYPNAVESSCLRQNDRYPVQIECVVATKQLQGRTDEHPRATVLNLSLGGCLIESPEAHDQGRILYLTLFIPEREAVCDLEIEVKRAAPQGSVHHLGTAFNDFLDPKYEEIKGYVNLLHTFGVRA